MTDQSTYEIVIGLEVHAQLLTLSKLFCGDSIAYGASPNTQVSPITLGHPGTLPKMNKKAIEHAIRMGLACHCEIERENYFARKNYFYPDLPKGYQISQHTTPICKGGYVEIKSGTERRQIRLNRIHLEEDAGKSLHDVDELNTCLDYNRAGTPLIEIVSEPDLRSAEETVAYLTELRKLVRYLDVCDGNMEEGSLRCDVNISVRKKGDTRLGTKVEVKNLNSIRNAKRAVEAEAARLIGLIENGEPVQQQTRSFDADKGTTFAIRDKEDADDYRYFADPDLTPFQLEESFIEEIRSALPVLQEDRVKKYTTELNLPEYDARVLTDEKELAEYYEATIVHTTLYKAAANWMLGPVKSWMNEHNRSIAEFPIQPAQLATLIQLTDEGKLSFSVASTKLFSYLLANPTVEPLKAAEQQNLLQQSNAGSLEPIIDEVLLKFKDKVAEYKKGKKGVLSLFVGEVMKRSKGKADPKVTNEIILEKLKN
ncbi:Asp-tRNA(Asn)/Glu-tRNA(Gln) amidotransferase subunit GatB [Terrimonas sp. NA20]|uniref:Aspartyl/glutamyl-tRNA(Asn/Gln) amidotransferase subunit B n=1 Tax=Terrimonas ginsenosidimutans TaxID=2908004 RepID=A0ABS9KQ75_9BACT|nr:Asp-tRNA(Asn)/Glu-tRNA(Gln) amidotransferase subunit GatB [Terrimonas ginsenosidimutans]MCG2614459.1 Asp-tRNA(Asn)/Glu-tRNA(Gln) amidotransferase subunit GatB [Terrimonas ginsenosidimutans]